MRILIIIFFFIILVSCSTEKKTDFNFFEGSWLSDSLFTKENDHWREFLYFDSIGLFNRTTLWGEDYLLSEDLQLTELSILQNGIATFSIHVVDSNQIILKGESYYGRFNRGPFPNIGSWREDLRNTRIGEAHRKLLLGSWELFDNSLAKSDTSIQYPDEWLKTKNLLQIHGHKIDTNLKVHVTLKHFVIRSDSAETIYDYVVNPNNIDISRSDYVVGLNYFVTKDTLTLKDSPMVGMTNTIKFVRQ